jgi:hypothetical protein
MKIEIEMFIENLNEMMTLAKEIEKLTSQSVHSTGPN